MDKKKYNSWRELFKDACLQEFKSTEGLYENRFIKDLEKRVLFNEDLNDSEKASVIERMFMTWENAFHDSRFSTVERLCSKVKKLSSVEEFERLLKNNSWEELGLDEDDKANISWIAKNIYDDFETLIYNYFDEFFEYNWFNEIFGDEIPEHLDLINDVELDMSNLKEFENKLKNNNVEYDACDDLLDLVKIGDAKFKKRKFDWFTCFDDRWFMSSWMAYENYSSEWNEDINHAIEDVLNLRKLNFANERNQNTNNGSQSKSCQSR